MLGGWLRQMSWYLFSWEGKSPAWPQAGGCRHRTRCSWYCCTERKLLLIQHSGTGVSQVIFCCLGLFYFEASPLVQLLQMFLQSSKNTTILLSDCMCLEWSPEAATQKWTGMSYLAEEDLPLCWSFAFSTDLYTVLVDL